MSGGSMGGYGEIFTAGASTFSTAVNWIMYGQGLKETRAAQDQAKQLAMLSRSDTLAQNAVQNRLASQQVGLSASAQKFNQAQTLHTQRQADADRSAAVPTNILAQQTGFQKYMKTLLGGL